MSAGPPNMFDDTSVYARLRAEVLPKLRTWPSTRVWQLGLTVPEDPWALAILLFEAGVLGRSAVFATDPDPARVARSERELQDAARLREAADAYRECGGTSSLEEYWLDTGLGARMRESLRARLCFHQYDARFDAPHNEFQLIVWRTPPEPFADSRAAAVVRASACRGGVVAFVGREPAEPLSRDSRFDAIAPRLLRRVR